MKINVEGGGKKWMEYLPDYFKTYPINKIKLPGTHDSAAYQLDFNISKGNKKIRLGHRASRMIPFVGNIITDWTKTQEYPIYEQLCNGIRYIDLRISVYHNNGMDYFYLSHTFTCVKLEIVLEDVKKFLQENKKEVLVLRFTSDWLHRNEMTKEMNKKAIKIIVSKLGKYLCYNDTNKFKTYGEMIDENRRIILYYGRYRNRNEECKFIWPKTFLYFPIDETSDVNVKLEKLNDHFLKMKKSQKILNVINITLTPQPDYIKRDIKKRILLPSKCCYNPESVYVYGKKIQQYFEQIMDANEEKVNYLSCVATDFPDADFILQVIKLNFIDKKI